MAQPYINKKQSDLARQRVNDSDSLATDPMSATGNQILELGIVAQKVTVTTTGTLSATVDFSIDGQNFYGSFTASSTPTTYSTNLVKLVRVTWISGSGTAVAAAV